MDALMASPEPLRVASEPFRGIVADILQQIPKVPTVPLGALIAPLSRRYDAELSEASSENSASLVIERLGATRLRRLADGDNLNVETALGRRGSSGEASLVLRTSSTVEAFRCDVQQLALTPGRLSPAATARSRPQAGAARDVVVLPGHLGAYSVASGDFNPLHLDLARCRALGLPERVVHGTLLATLAESCATGGETGSLTMRFAAPCFAAETLHLSVAARPQGASRVTIHGADGRLCCVMDRRSTT